MTHEEIRITPGFDLNMDIIHAYAPIYLNEKDPINKLLSVYKILFEEISKKKYKKVLLCSLGTGFQKPVDKRNQKRYYLIGFKKPRRNCSG
jgi:hypothetical protein